MKGWTMPIQQASYRGVRFDVLSVDDNLERATITHAYPFVNGGDIEDLGLNPLTIQLQAVFYGEGYYTDFKRFLSALEKQGAAVLVHPIRGRLQNMLCTSAYFHHEADFVDYVTVSLSFQEATPAKPIFLFNISVLGLIDELLTKLEDLVDDVLELYGFFMEGISFAANVKSRLLGSFGALYGCFEQIRDMFDMDDKKHVISANTPSSKDAFRQQGGNTVRDMAGMIRDGLTSIANRDDLTVRAKFDEVTRAVKSLLEIAPNLSNGKNSKSNTLKSLTSSLTAQDTKEIFCAVQLLATANVLKIATRFIEDDSLIPSEIDYIVTESRLQALAALNTVRALVQAEQNAMTLHYVKDDFGLMSLSAKKQAGAKYLQTPNTGLYTQAYNTAEKLRQQSHKLTQLALAAINRKPPLIIRTVEFDSTIQQVAHAFYGDYTRASELLRLNPHIRYPNFITRGEVLNGYANNGYPFNNEIVVEIDGKQHKNWKSYDIDSDFLIPADAFNFSIGVPSDNTVLADYSGKTAKVLINGELVLTGIVDTTQHSISKTDRTFSLNGRDKASILVDCSAPITNVKGLTVLDAIKKIVEPLGIKKVELRAESNPTLDKVDIDIGETAWNALIHCANSAGLHAWFDPTGTLIVGGADYSTPPVATLCCAKNGKRNNFTQASLTTDVSQSFSEITFLAQRHGRSGDDNKNDLKWVFKDDAIETYKPKTVIVSDVENLEALKKWAKKYITDSILNSFTLTITVPDHKTQDGVLWTPGQRVHVICQEYDIDAIFFLMGRRFTLSRQGGTTTELRLKQDGVWTPDAYTNKSKEARKRKGKKGKKNKGDLIVLDGD